MKCRLCQDERTSFFLRVHNVHGRHKWSDESFDLYRCRQCRVIFTDIEADGSYYSKYYPPNYYEGPTGNLFMRSFLFLLQKIGFDRRIRLIKKFSRSASPCRILEIGCGRGEFLGYLPAAFVKYGAEINLRACDYIREHRRDITLIDINALESGIPFDDRPFDVVGLWHVFEHIRDPHSFLKMTAHLLSRNGVIILEIPNAGSLGLRWTRSAWFHLDTPRHLFFYDRESLGRLLEQHGFEVLRYRADPIDYFQDFAASLYTMIRTKNSSTDFFICVTVMPLATILRIFLGICFPSIAEVNTYVIRRPL